MKRDKELDSLMESMPPETAFAIFMRQQSGMSKSRMAQELSGATAHQRRVEGNGRWPVVAKSPLPMPKPSAYLVWLISVRQEVNRFEQQRLEQIREAKERELDRLRKQQRNERKAS